MTNNTESPSSNTMTENNELIDKFQDMLDATMQKHTKKMNRKLDQIGQRITDLETKTSTEMKNRFAEFETKFDSFKTEMRDRTRVVKEMGITRQQSKAFHGIPHYPEEHIVPGGYQLLDTPEDFISERRYRR